MKYLDQLHRLNQNLDDALLPRDEVRLAIQSIISDGSVSRVFAEDPLSHDIWIFAGKNHTRIPMPESEQARKDIATHPLSSESAHLTSALKSRSEIEALSIQLNQKS